MRRLPEQLRDEGTDLDRIKAFSDGVFAIAITILVLGLELPERKSGARLADHLGGLVLPLMTYAFSFMIVGMYWVIHCRLLRYMIAHNRGVSFYNLLLLFFVTLVPFTAQLPARYLGDALGWILYFANLAMVAFSGALLWAQAWRGGYLREDVSPILKRYILARACVPGVAFGLTAIFSVYSLSIATWIPILIPPMMILVNRHFSKLV